MSAASKWHVNNERKAHTVLCGMVIGSVEDLPQVRHQYLMTHANWFALVIGVQAILTLCLRDSMTMFFCNQNVLCRQAENISVIEYNDL